MKGSFEVPRRRGFAIAWTILRITLMAYLQGHRDITFEMGHD